MTRAKARCVATWLVAIWPAVVVNGLQNSISCGTNSGEQSCYFQYSTSDVCGRASTATAWTASSKLSCFMKCLTLHSGNCRNLVYNSVSRTCTAVAPNHSWDQQLRTPQPGDQLYTQTMSPSHVSACKQSAGFQFLSRCGESACVFISGTRQNYSLARHDCEAMGASLFVTPTVERLHFLGSIIHDPQFFVAAYLDSDQFFWETGEILGSNSHLWGPYQPNGGEDCVLAFHDNSNTLHDRMHDVSCSSHYFYACEREV